MPGNIVLVGFSGSGKSSVGRLLAARLGRPFVDTDERLVARFGMPIGDFFRVRGESAFRDAEVEEVRAACTRAGAVLSLGGGAVVRPDSLKAAREGNFVVRLGASVTTILERLTASPEAEERPMLAGDDPRGRIARLLAERMPLYRQADAGVCTDGMSVEAVVEEILRLWRNRRRPASALHVEAGAAIRLGEILRSLNIHGRIFLISDDNVARLHGGQVERALTAAGYQTASRAIRPVEASKSLATASELYGWLASERAERGDVVVALGGGVVGDLAGFVAATYLRGLPIVQIPTTLLAQVDSAIGGKTGVNLEEGKNLVGAWHMPAAVVVDPRLLSTLPKREIVAGWTETIKHALIMDDGLLRLIEANVDSLLALEPDLTTEVVGRSARLKVDVVEEDPREVGRRVILNYGHTIGHALEAASDYRRFLHGEAVAIGMVGAAHIGRLVGATPEDLERRQNALLRQFGLPISATGLPLERVLEAMRLDKKVEARQQRWVVLLDVAEPAVRRDVPDEVSTGTVRALVT